MVRGAAPNLVEETRVWSGVSQPSNEVRNSRPYLLRGRLVRGFPDRRKCSELAVLSPRVGSNHAYSGSIVAWSGLLTFSGEMCAEHIQRSAVHPYPMQI